MTCLPCDIGKSYTILRFKKIDAIDVTVDYTTVGYLNICSK